MKEKVATILSGIAIIISIISAIASFSQNESNSERTVRDQLTATVSELIKLNSSNARLLATPRNQQDMMYFQEMSTNSQMAASITRQSVFLVEKHPKVATDVDYVAIAQGLMIVGDNVLADTFMRTAIDKSPSDFYKIINLRGYASFLFGQGKHELGRNMYKKAVEIFDNDTDFNKQTNAYTYQMWMNSEGWSGFPQESEIFYQRAINIAKSISVEPMKQNILRGINQTKFTIPK